MPVGLVAGGFKGCQRGEIGLLGIFPIDGHALELGDQRGIILADAAGFGAGAGEVAEWGEIVMANFGRFSF